MGLDLRPKKDRVVVTLDMDTVFLHPTPTPNEPTEQEVWLRGSCALYLAGARSVARLRVVLVGLMSFGGGEYRYETLECLRKVLEIDLRGERLSKGKHSYHFSFLIPSTTAVQERSKFGTIRHSVRAAVEGVGKFGTSISSTYTPVWIIANPAPIGDLPQGVEVLVQDFGSVVGPIAFNISSPHLTVASLLFFNISFLAPPAISIMSVTGYILQQFTLKYGKDNGGDVLPPPQKKLLFYVDQTIKDAESSTEDLITQGRVGKGASIPLGYESRSFAPKPFVKLEAGKEWSYSRIVRLPDDDHVRPTTLDATNTRIRVKHRICTDVKFRLAGSKKDMLLSMSSDVTIASCCCLIDSLLLPSYTHSAPASGPIRPFHRRCLCNQTLRQMVEKDGKALQSADVRPRSTSVTSPKLGLPEGQQYIDVDVGLAAPPPCSIPMMPVRSSRPAIDIIV